MNISKNNEVKIIYMTQQWIETNITKHLQFKAIEIPLSDG